ncbi:MAG: CPBP family intramembrane metalloprotease, partial [Chloroflexi bacterium]|nr:CPBP family intramembrane metalloprotease [Chloroflexota bacterium]
MGDRPLAGREQRTLQLLKKMGITRGDIKTLTVIVGSTLLLVLERYHNLGGNAWISALIFYLIIPLAIIGLVLREDPRRWGMALGDGRKGLLYALGTIAAVAAVIAFVSRLPEFRSYYAVKAFADPRGIPGYALENLLFMIGWEYLFRGFLLFGLAERFGRWAILLQAVPFAVAHLGKPELETLSTIFGGSWFGWVAWDARAV